MTKSIICNEKRCFICGFYLQVDRHHCFHGTANRKLAEQDGCWVYLCHKHHTGGDGVHDNMPFDEMLKKFTQLKWEERFGDRNDFIKRYGKSYL